MSDLLSQEEFEELTQKIREGDDDKTYYGEEDADKAYAVALCRIAELENAATMEATMARVCDNCLAKGEAQDDYASCNVYVILKRTK